MNEITVPWHFVVTGVVSLVALIFLLSLRKRIIQGKNRPLYFSMLSFVCVYLLIVCYSAAIDVYYQWDLNRYDLDKDGIFSGAELTPQQKVAMAKLINDVGRNLS